MTSEEILKEMKEFINDIDIYEYYVAWTPQVILASPQGADKR
jgi:hypothetical protein